MGLYQFLAGFFHADGLAFGSALGHTIQFSFFPGISSLAGKPVLCHYILVIQKNMRGGLIVLRDGIRPQTAIREQEER